MQFTCSQREEARRQALELALAKARSKAEAKAAGGSLGGLIELSAEPESVQPKFYQIQTSMLQAAPVVAPMPIAPNRLTISAMVSGKWYTASAKCST